MSRPHYSEYVGHCLRFYTRHKEPRFSSNVDRLNWEACRDALNTFCDSDRTLLHEVYSERDTMSDNVYQICKRENLCQDTLWKMVNDLEREVARVRGLI